MRLRGFILAFLLVLMPFSAYAQGEKALMLTVFGTSTEASVTFDELVPMVKESFPDRKLVVPYTSGVIRTKLNAEIKNPEERILSPEEMLNKLKGEGFTDIAVVSTLLFPGVEHDKLKASVDKFSQENKSLKVSYTPPLMTLEENRQPVVNTLKKYMLKDGANLVVSHGSHDGHSVEKAYLNLADLVSKTYPNSRMASIEGLPSMEEALLWIKGNKAQDIRFIVFMFVAGDHAENDIASDDEDSLFSAVKAMGKTPSLFMVDTQTGKRIASLGLDPEYRQLLLDYYAQALKK